MESTAQILSLPVSNYDRDTILRQIYPEVTTRRLLLVGHSQGTLYTDEMYDYLLAHGEPKEAVGVYNIASPTYEKPEDGNYLNSTNDSLLNFVEQRLGIPLLPRNVDIPTWVDTSHKEWPGHSLSDAYLAGAPERVVGDMKELVGTLKPSLSTDTGDCFTPPQAGLIYKTQSALLSIADPLASGVKIAAQTSYAGAVAAVVFAVDAGKQVAADIGTTIGGIRALSQGGTAAQQTTYDLVNRLYAGQNQKVDNESVQDLLGQGGAVVLALAPQEPPADDPVFPPPAVPPADDNGPSVPIGPAPGVSPGGGGSSAPPPALTPISTPDPDPATTTDPVATTTPATSTPPTAIDAAYVTDNWPITGFYCDGDTSILTGPTSVTYHPASNNCNYLGGFSNIDWILRAYLLKGVVGSSTVVAEVGSNGSGKVYIDHSYDFGVAQPGDTYTVVLMEYSTNIGAQFNANLLPELYSYLTTGLDTNGTPQAPALLTYAIPFTYTP